MGEQSLAQARWEDQSEISRKFPFNFENFWLGRAEDHATIGYNDDRHICLVSGSRGGKGTSIIVNNLCFWPGSAVVIDPKGENATVTAARRGRGNSQCEGMGQTVLVLDPFEVAQVQGRYRSSFNPLDALDPHNERCIDDAARVANALIVVREDSKDPFFDESARALVKALILHVLTADEFEAADRTLSMVNDLLKRGEWRIAEAMQGAMEGGGEEDINSHQLLFRAMEQNQAFGGVVAGNGTRYLAMLKNSPKTFDNVLQAALINTEFLDSPGMRRVVAKSQFKLSQLKGDPAGVTLYLCLPQDYMETHYRWLRLMVMLTMGEMQKTLRQPKHRVLMVLDEFAGLKRMPAIESAVAQIAGFGVKLFFVLQSLEQLKATYKENWETFLSNAGLKLFFSIDDHFTRQYVSNLMGMAEVMRSTESESEGTSENENVSHGTSRSESRSSGTSQGRNTSRSDSISDGINTGRNRSTNESRSQGENWGQNWGTSESQSEGKNWSQGGSSGVSYKEQSSFFGLFRSIDKNSVTYSSGSNFSFGGSSSVSASQSRGGSRGGSSGTSAGSSQGTSEGRSRSRSQSTSEGENFSTNESVSSSTGENESHSHGTGRSSTRSRNQAIHQRPLLRPEEFGKLFARLDHPDHPAYPGFALVLISGTDPLIVRRCNYFDDVQFIDCFSPHPNHRFQAALTSTVDSIQFWLDTLSAATSGEKLQVGSWQFRPHEIVTAGDVLFKIAKVPRDGRTIAVRAPCNGKLLAFANRPLNAADPSKHWPLTSALVLVKVRYYPGQQSDIIDPIAELREACSRLQIAPPEPPPLKAAKEPSRLLLLLLGTVAFLGVGLMLLGLWQSSPMAVLLILALGTFAVLFHYRKSIRVWIDINQRIYPKVISQQRKKLSLFFQPGLKSLKAPPRRSLALSRKEKQVALLILGALGITVLTLWILASDQFLSDTIRAHPVDSVLVILFCLFGVWNVWKRTRKKPFVRSRS